MEKDQKPTESPNLAAKTEPAAKKCLTPKQLSSRYEGSTAPITLAAWRRRGGGRIWYSMADLIAWIEARRQQDKTPPA